MPHVIVKLWPGRSEEQKKKLTEEIARDMVATLKCNADSISIAFEEVKPEEWNDKVYDRDIGPKLDKLYKKPGYKR